jgi:hypothetical protein
MGAAGSPETMEPIHILEDYILIFISVRTWNLSYFSVLVLNISPTQIKNISLLKVRVYQIPAFSKMSTFWEVQESSLWV